MAVVLGTNSGFVSTAPTADPNGTDTTFDNTIQVTRDTSPASATRITEIGWYCNNATEAANYEVGLYAADGAVVPGEAGTLLHVVRTNAKSTDAGWKRVIVDWTITPSTTYWLAVQLDNTATATASDRSATTGAFDTLSAQTTLVNPLGAGAFFANFSLAIYAVWSSTKGNFFRMM